MSGVRLGLVATQISWTRPSSCDLPGDTASTWLGIQLPLGAAFECSPTLGESQQDHKCSLLLGYWIFIEGEALCSDPSHCLQTGLWSSKPSRVLSSFLDLPFGEALTRRPGAAQTSGCLTPQLWTQPPCFLCEPCMGCRSLVVFSQTLQTNIRHALKCGREWRDWGRLSSPWSSPGQWCPHPRGSVPPPLGLC